MPELNDHTIKNFTGGIADEEGRGVAGSFKRGWNLNIHQKGKNTLSANQKLKKISGTTVVDLIIRIVPVTSTKSYGFGNAGNVYKIESETVTKIYTDPNGAILDAEYFYGYLYWTTAGKLGRCIETSSDWNTDAAPNWKTLNSSSYHSIFVVPKSDLMCIGNGRYIATLSSAAVWNDQALDLFFGWEEHCLSLIKPCLLIGAKDHKKAEMFTWDLQSASYDPIEGWEERDINAFFRGVGATYIFTPTLLYWFREGLVDTAKELPAEVRRGAVDIWKGKMLFGTTNGIYSYHKKNKNYPLALNLEYTPSPITITNFDSKSIEIGAILGRGNDFLVAWKDGSSYGLDNVDTSNKADACYESLSFDAERSFEEELFRYIKIVTKPLPTGCSVKVKHRMNTADDWEETKMGDGSETFDKGTYGTGTVSMTQGSNEVTGSGTSWTSAMAGRKFKITGESKTYKIRDVVSATALTLEDAYEGTTGSGKSYAILGATKAVFQTEGQGEVYEVRVELYSSGNSTPEIVSINSYFEGSNIY